MRTSPMYVTQMGALYRLTPSQWRAYLKHRSNGWVNIENYGVMLSPKIPNVTDWDEGRAQFELTEFETGIGQHV